MLTPVELLSAMGGVKEEYVLEAQEALGYTAEVQRHSHRKIWRVALIAALITAILSVTAYALGWLGLKERSFDTPSPSFSTPRLPPRQTEAVPLETEEITHWVSMNGYKDSAEYKANAEWVAFYWDYVQNSEHDFSDDFPEGEEQDYVEICHYYGCYDKTMADKLFEIAERYGLKLHTWRYTPATLPEFYATAGTGNFLTENVLGNGYVYEDGSFMLQGDIRPYGLPENSGAPDRVFSFYVHKSLAGTVIPYFSSSDDPENYTEWEYTNQHGDTVLMSFDETRGRLMVFFDSDGVFLQMNAGSIYEPIESREEAEHIADQFIFHEALKTNMANEAQK